jgi:hypothetical protein
MHRPFISVLASEQRSRRFFSGGEDTGKMGLIVYAYVLVSTWFLEKNLSVNMR